MKEDKENKTYTVEYKIDIPVVIFTYKEKKGDKEVVFERRFAYNAMFEKFGIKKEESDESNPEKIVQAIEKCFSEKKVSLEIFKKTEYALEFKEENSVLFKAFLEPTLQCNQIRMKENPDQKVNIKWEINIPNVIFSYIDEYGVVFECAIDYNCMFEKFGIKQKEEDIKNGLNLQGIITNYFYNDKVSFEISDGKGISTRAIEFKGEGNTTLFKVFLKAKKNANLVTIKEHPEQKFCVEWIIEIPTVFFTHKEIKDGKEIVTQAHLDYNCTFEKFGIKKEEKDNNNPQGLTSVIKKYFDEGKVVVREFKVGHEIVYNVEFIGEGDKTLFQLPLK